MMFGIQHKIRVSASLLMPIAATVLIIVCIEIVVRLSDIPSYIFPPPSDVLTTSYAAAAMILSHLGVTFAEALLGYLAANAAAFLFAVIFSQLKLAKRSLYPLIIALQAVPVVAIAPFVQIWFGPGIIGKAVLSALICVFPSTIIMTSGLAYVNTDALAYFRSLGASKSVVFWQLVLPSNVPTLLSALQVTATLCVVGAVVGELAGASRGAGYLIVRASYQFDTAMLFAVLLYLSAATLLFFGLIQWTGTQCSKRYVLRYANLQR